MTWDLGSGLVSDFEDSFLAAVAQAAKVKGARKLTGKFLPTAKNKPAEEFYEHSGFVCKEQAEDSMTWEADIKKVIPTNPDWIACTFDGVVVT